MRKQEGPVSPDKLKVGKRYRLSLIPMPGDGFERYEGTGVVEHYEGFGLWSFIKLKPRLPGCTRAFFGAQDVLRQVKRKRK